VTSPHAKQLIRTVIVLGLIAAGVGLYFRTHNSSTELSSSPIAVTPPDAWVGRTAPDFSLRSLDDKLVRLSNFRGRVTLVNFWATWCAPCRVEMPSLVNLRAKYRDRGFDVIGVSVDDGDRSKVEAFVKEVNADYPILLKDGSVSDAYGGTRFLPQSFMVDRDGKVLAHIVGMRSKDELDAEIKKALSTAARSAENRH
jgi:peroxiredoxin